MIKFIRLSIMAAIAVVICIPFTNVAAQGCIEIKSILVDACGTPEGENEMVRFDVGSAALNTSNLVVDWPNNPWQGLCQDATTAGIVTNINGLIQGCGSVTEPAGGVLPANAKVLLLTSLNINAILNSFANLNDDLIVLFQCNGNTSGHFANFNITPGLRTLIIEFTGAGGCIDSVTYDRTMLVNQYGAIGGFTFENDGAFVEFSNSGTPTYLNYGCQVLSTGLALSGGPDVGICPGAANSANLNGTAINLVGTPLWSGGTGTFNPNNALTSVYTPGTGETGLVYLTIVGNGSCNTSITDTVRLNIVPSLPTVSISSSVSGTFTSSITDTTYFYNWYPDGSSVYIPGAFNPTYTPSSNGCYYMILSTIGGCTVQSNTLCITNVGINEIGETPQVNLFGNPGDAPWLSVESPKLSGVIRLSIVDIYGRVISRNNISSKGTLLEIHPDWSAIASGMYVIKLSDDNWSVETRVMLSH